MINPYNSPHYKPRTKFIQDKPLYFRWADINKYLPPNTYVPLVEQHGMLKIILEDGFLIAKKSPKFRPIGIIDWAHYTPKNLAFAILTGNLQSYYNFMLSDSRSDPNIWRDAIEEYTLKTFYKQRAGK
tara:strand:- start:274 stop:657 length:384 start_codon:yes stop_codon:yes gene_type:complete